MGKILKVYEAELPLIAAGTYVAQFEDYEERPGLKFGDTVVLKFKITDSKSDSYGIILNIMCSDKFTKGKKNSKLYDVVTTLLGEEPKKDADLDLDSLKETMCQIVVKTKESGDRKFSTITEVLPMKNT